MDEKANSSGGSDGDTKNLHSSLIWTIRKVVFAALILIEGSKLLGKIAMEYLIDEGYVFGKVEESKEEELDLDDTLPARLTEMGLQILLPVIFLPHLLAYFLPQLRTILAAKRDT